MKIGDILTMVVEAEGDDDVDVRVRQCIAMNGDAGAPGDLVVSTSNRNFIGRQGKFPFVDSLYVSDVG